jgi:hypothetical protein
VNRCKNPECGKEIPENLNYCSESCLRKHIELKTQAKELAKTNSDVQVKEIPSETDPNEGTRSKTVLKNKALRYVGTYPDNLTPKQYASRLCWDLSVSFRTALEGYIEPMVEKGILLHVRENLYKVNPKYREEQR